MRFYRILLSQDFQTDTTKYKNDADILESAEAVPPKLLAMLPRLVCLCNLFADPDKHAAALTIVACSFGAPRSWLTSCVTDLRWLQQHFSFLEGVTCESSDAHVLTTLAAKPQMYKKLLKIHLHSSQARGIGCWAVSKAERSLIAHYNFPECARQFFFTPSFSCSQVQIAWVFFEVAEFSSVKFSKLSCLPMVFSYN